jgi:hypothetical protein
VIIKGYQGDCSIVEAPSCRVIGQDYEAKVKEGEELAGIMPMW